MNNNSNPHQIKRSIEDIIKGQFYGFPNINYKLLKSICKWSPEKIANEFDLTQVVIFDEKNKPQTYFYKNNGSNILAVAHLDTVLPYTHFDTVKLVNDTRIYSPVLDDRLGAYIILDLLPLKNIKCDILFTVGEEKLMSTAAYFQLPRDKRYNWMFSFDKDGTDSVLYQYHSQQLVDLLESFSFTTPKSSYRSSYNSAYSGTYSDLVELDDLGCVGINFGTGYYNKHMIDSYASRVDILSQVVKFKFFYNAMVDTHLPYERYPSLFNKEKSDKAVNANAKIIQIPATSPESSLKYGPTMQNIYGYPDKKGAKMGIIKQSNIDNKAKEEEALVRYEYGTAEPEAVEELWTKKRANDSLIVRKTKAQILLSDPDVLLLSDEARQFLEHNNFYMIVEFAMFSYHNLLLLPGATREIVSEIGNRLLNVGLSLNINLEPYGIEVTPVYDEFKRFLYNSFEFSGPLWENEAKANTSDKLMQPDSRLCLFFYSYKMVPQEDTKPKESVDISAEFDFLPYTPYEEILTKSGQIVLNLSGYDMVRDLNTRKWQIVKSSQNATARLKLKPGFVVM